MDEAEAITSQVTFAASAASASRDAIPPVGWQTAEDVNRYSEPGPANTAWVDQLRGPNMSVGTYSIPAGGLDDQVPHREDEVYVVTQGRATLIVSGERIPVSPGTAVHVSAGVEHQFVDVVENLAVVVVFSPPYSGR